MSPRRAVCEGRRSPWRSPRPASPSTAPSTPPWTHWRRASWKRPARSPAESICSSAMATTCARRAPSGFPAAMPRPPTRRNSEAPLAPRSGRSRLARPSSTRAACTRASPPPADAAQQRGAPRAAIRAIEARATVIDEDVMSRRLADPRFAPLHELMRDAPWSVIVSLPLMHHGAAIGALNAYYPSGQRPPEIDMSFLRAMADQATSAVDYARLLRASREKVALEERQRLARDLHDSVSQAVYGIALGARSAMELLAADPSQVREPLEYVLRLSEAALAEMRALIFELRPEALEREGLTGALKHHTAVLRARHGIAVEESLTGEPAMSWESKQALYRIAQEALHNAGRHARATRVRIGLSEEDAQIRLEVSDNGVGFDSQGTYPGHFGLNTMRERANELGGSLEIESRPQAGTSVRAVIPAFRSDSS